MTKDNNNHLIPFDRMKEQIEKELHNYIDNNNSLEDISLPKITFERGSTQISFIIPNLNERFVVDCIVLIKNALDNVRIHSFESGYYAFQALNKNLFLTENMLNNMKIELFGLISKFRVDASKKGDLIQEELNLIIDLYKRAYYVTQDNPIEQLKMLGATVFTDITSYDWSYIAGYNEVKRKIKESILLPLQNPKIYDAIAHLTRRKFESNKPRAILFEGNPGVGKTTIAKIIAGDGKIPLVYVPIESIMSKWYGESPRNLSQIFDASEKLGGSILFLDEIDSLAGSRDNNLFEATRRILSVLLRKLDGIDSVVNTITIGATNRKHDLDHALLSRFDQTIHFPLPNDKERAAIFSNYATHLKADETTALGEISDGLSGRNIKDICEITERRWARRLIIKKINPSAPPDRYYMNVLKKWLVDENYG